MAIRISIRQPEIKKRNEHQKQNKNISLKATLNNDHSLTLKK